MTLYKISVFEHKPRCKFQHFIHICEHMHKCIDEVLGFLFFLKYPQQFLHEKSREMTRPKSNLDIIEDRTELVYYYSARSTFTV